MTNSTQTNLAPSFIECSSADMTDERTPVSKTNIYGGYDPAAGAPRPFHRTVRAGDTVEIGSGQTIVVHPSANY